MPFATVEPAVLTTEVPLPVELAPTDLRAARFAGPHGRLAARHEVQRVAEARPATAVGLLQRACSCGGTPGPDGECAECKAKRLERESATSVSGVPDEDTASDELGISISQSPGDAARTGGGPAKPATPATPCPTSIKVAEITMLPVTSAQVAQGVRAGWGAITRMEVSGGAQKNWDGTKVKEKLSTGTNDCDKTPGCANTSAQAGNAGSTFTVGSASPAFKHPKLGEVIPAMPAKQNCFYDIHVQGGFVDWCAATGSCSRGCTQEYECAGSTFGSTFTVSWTYSKASHKDAKGGSYSVCEAAFTKK